MALDDAFDGGAQPGTVLFFNNYYDNIAVTFGRPRFTLRCSIALAIVPPADHMIHLRRNGGPGLPRHAALPGAWQ
jgi:hypothetical protein